MLKALDQVNSKYQESTDLVRDQEREMKKLMTKEAELIAGRAKANNPTQVAQYNAKLKETAEQINKMKRYIDETTNANKNLSKESTTLTSKLRDAFDNTRIVAAKNEVEKFNKKIGEGEKPTQSLRAQLKELKAQLAATDDDQEFLKLSIQAGQLQDKIDDASQAARIFATGTPLQAFGNGIKGVAGDLLSLDFEGAAQKSQLLVKASQQLTFKGSLEGIKQLGTTLFNTGKALLSNPLFLIGAAVTLIITNFEALKSSGGAIGTLFTAIGDAVTFAKEAFFSLTDAIGLTDIAADKLAKKRDEATNKEVRNLDIEDKRRVDSYNLQIRLLQAEGKETFALEAEKNAFIQKSARLKRDILTNNLSNSKEEAAEQKKIIGELIDTEREAREANEVLTVEYNKRLSDAAKKRYEELTENERKAVEHNLKVRQAEYDQLLKMNREYLTEKEADNLSAYERDEKLRKQRQQDEVDGNDLFEKLAIAEDEKENARVKKKEEDAAIARKQRIDAELTGIQTVTSATVSASQQIVNAKIREVDQLRALQEKRVSDVKEIADKGNAELYELEQKRLDDLNTQRQKFVKQQQALATIELVANTAIAVSKAAAQGGVAAPFTIAAALIALTAGLVQARSIASSAAFYEGGYTGDGDPKAESTAIGRKPYTYHKGEFVFNHEKTGKYKDIFQDIHKGHIDLRDWQNKVQAFEAMRYMPMGGSEIDISSLEKRLDGLTMVIQNQYTSLNFDEHGLSARFQNIKARQEFIQNRLAR